jgi:tetratricopeptide (TPR) repeat protein
LTKPSKFRAARLSSGLSLAEAAQGVCSVSYLSLIERGLRTPTSEIAEALNSKYGLPSDEFSDLTDEVRTKMGLLAIKMGDLEQAEEVLAALPETDALVLKGLVLEARGGFSLAVEHLKAALENNELGHDLKVAGWLGYIRTLREEGDLFASAIAGERLIEFLTSASTNNGSAFVEATATLSSVFIELGDLKSAQRVLESLPSHPPSLKDEGMALWSKGMLAYSNGNLVRADEFLTSAASIMGHLGQAATQARLTQTAAWIKLEAGQSLDSTDLISVESAAKLFREQGLLYDLALTSNTLALAKLRFLDSGEALDLIKDSAEIGEGLGGFSGARVLELNGRLALLANETNLGESYLRNALHFLSTCEPTRLHSKVWAQLAIAFDLLGDTQTSIRCYRSSLETSGLLNPTDSLVRPSKSNSEP